VWFRATCWSSKEHPSPAFAASGNAKLQRTLELSARHLHHG
jgi:hypothetical protein